MRSQARSFRSFAALALAGSAALAAGVSVAFGDPEPLRPSPESNPPGTVMAQGTGKATDNAPLTPTTPDMKAVQDLLGRATDDIVLGHGPDLIGLLSRADRNRINAPGDWPDVDKAAEGFRSAWQARFGSSFKLADKIPVVMSEPAVHVTGLEPTAGGPSTAPTAVRKTNASVVLKSPGRRSATAVKLANEGTNKPDWRFDLPDTVTAESLHASLLQHLNAITANQTRWPTDVDQAYVYATQHLLAAIGDAAAPR